MSAVVRGAALLLTAGCLVLASGAPALAQESESERRARLLEVFERLLTETVQLHLSREMDAVKVTAELPEQEDGAAAGRIYYAGQKRNSISVPHIDEDIRSE